MKSLIFVNSGEAGGAEKVVSILSNNFSIDDVGLVFINDNVFYEFNNNMEVFILNKNKNKNLIALAIELKKIIKRNDIITVQSHMYRSNYINILAKLLGSKHKVQIVNCDCVSTKYVDGLKSIVSKFLIRTLYPFSDLTITKSKAMLEDLKLYSNIKNSIVINNPVDIERINELKHEPSLYFNRDDYKFEKILVNVGRFHEQKRQKDIIEALSMLDESYGLVLIGDGEHLQACKKLVIELNLSDRVVFTGKVKNPFSILSQCDVFVMSSSCEGFPNALAEAMACSLPIISSDHLSGAKEILSLKGNFLDIKQYNDNYSIEEYGVLYPVGNVEELIKSIKYIFDNNMIECYQKKSILRVKEYDISKSIKVYQDVINSYKYD
ncbi:glycosyltransferase [Aliivibrio fischeri]|uniref:Glycosyltransferase n=1 Tax=Aliivibrio fischeri TaxID=668 RepID=A0A6N3YXS9_ALIFS|nr:glycosyltransferase [Aliivibrio fischeri]MUK46109.1 glycosyltransferase [Aliivibrio fischeri]MUK79243.1 glycosyltransferase [Aliivibrio fischeri]MUK85885.1 glycosyltransferase [Aliivibrio fischeri]